MRFGFIQGVAIWEKIWLQEFSVLNLIHTQLQAGCHCTSDKEAFLYIRLRMTPQYSIDRSQRRKDYMYCTVYATVGSPCMLYM